MKKIFVPKIVPATNNVSDIEKAFALVEGHAVDCCNWPAEFPYTPKVEVKLFHSSDRLYIKFDVTEKDIQAAVAEDQGRTWTDPCVEFLDRKSVV